MFQLNLKKIGGDLLTGKSIDYKEYGVKKMKKENKLVLLICLLALFVYFCSNFTFVKYRDKTMLGFCFRPLADVEDGIFLSWGELETSLGTIKIKPFCRFRAYNRYLTRISWESFKTGRAEHDISILGNILGNPHISFEHSDIERMVINQIMDIQGRRIHVDFVTPIYNENGEAVDIEIAFIGNPDMTDNKIVLSDGTIIEYKSDYQDDLFLVAPVVQDTANIWEMGVGGWFSDASYFFVTRNEGDEPEKYVSITFEENWGRFIDGERKIEPEPQTFDSDEFLWRYFEFMEGL
jgi:hypothetical protein